MTKSPSERPNRVVTCQDCGVQMPQRYLAGHMQLHMPASGEALPLVDENPAVKNGATQPPALSPATAETENAEVLVCPACAAFVSEGEFPQHMLAQHTNWCPLCYAQTKDLAGHLSSKHRLKPIKPVPLFERNWKMQKRFTCLQCKKKVSVRSYPRHEGPHSSTRGPAEIG